jgi:glycolate oxidase iron-sulfur subunit
MYVLFKKIFTRDHAGFMETIPHESKKILFYPGCYIYSKETIRLTRNLLDYVGKPYNILGGLNTCCGIPQMVQGEFDLADHYLDLLYEKIKKINPEIIITGCAECLEALLRINAKHNEDFQIKSIVEYLHDHIDMFPKRKIRNMVTFHDSCRLSWRYHRGDASRKVLQRFSDFKELPEAIQQTLCCYHWNQNYDKANKENKKISLEKAEKTAPVIACDCLTCYEEYKKISKNIEIVDILQLFHESIQHQKDTRENNP